MNLDPLRAQGVYCFRDWWCGAGPGVPRATVKLKYALRG